MHSVTSSTPSMVHVQVKSCEQEANAPTAKKAKNTFFITEKFRLEYHGEFSIWVPRTQHGS
jgi:hypothetical protein